MSDLNLCQFIGRLGKDPETRYLANGDAVANFSIAVGESWKDKNSGEKKETTEWIRCTAWRRLGEIVGEYLKKGSQVYVAGKWKTRKWEKDGVDHYITELQVDQMQMLGSKQSGDGGGQRDSEERPQQRSALAVAKKPAGQFQDMADDIPF